MRNLIFLLHLFRAEFVIGKHAHAIALQVCLITSLAMRVASGALIKITNTKTATFVIGMVNGGAGSPPG